MAIKRVETQDGVRWRLRFYLGRDPETGKREVLTETYDRKKDAESRETELKRQRDTGLLVRPSREPLAKYMSEWVENVKATEVRPQTLYDYRRIVRRYLADPPNPETPPIGKVPLHRLTSEAVQKLYTYLWEDEGLAPRTIRYLHAVLRQCLSYAVNTGALARNPTDAVTVPKRRSDGRGRPEGAMRAMSREEAGKFVEAARGRRLEALWLVLVTGGLRPAEALGLLWRDVDLEAGKLHVRRTLLRRGVKGWKLEEPKTARARRTVVLPDSAAQALRDWNTTQKRERLKAGGEYEDHGFVFANHFGKPLHRTNVARRGYRRVLEAAGLGTYEGEGKDRRFVPGFRLYDLRHTCATLLLLAGENPKVVSERLGHASIALTLDTYSHVLPSMQEQAAEKLERLFGSAS